MMLGVADMQNAAVIGFWGLAANFQKASKVKQCVAGSDSSKENIGGYCIKLESK